LLGIIGRNNANKLLVSFRAICGDGDAFDCDDRQLRVDFHVISIVAVIETTYAVSLIHAGVVPGRHGALEQNFEFSS
jgi:hypothetical protein